MSRPIKFCGSDSHVFEIQSWLPVHLDPNSTELWIDMHYFQRIDNGIWPCTREAVPDDLIATAEKIVVIDFGTGQPSLEDGEIAWVQHLAQQRPLTWLTLNPKPIPNVKTVRFDYYWNRTKKTFLEQQLTHKLCGVENFVQYPVHTRLRESKFLTYYSRSEPWRDLVKQHLVSRYNGFYNDSVNQRWLEPNTDIGQHNKFQSSCAPPARRYFDESYVTCLVETCYRNHNSILFSEKTYDHLIQGRAVLNFATPGFYQQLSADGWAMPSGIDLSWDSIQDDNLRLQAYLAELDKLLNRPMGDLHQWFVDNLQVWKHNQSMLHTKPYDIIDFGSF